MSETPKIALVAITKHGCAHAARAARLLDNVTVATPAKYASAFDGIDARLLAYDGPSKAQIGPLFAQFDQIVFFVSIGAVVRLIAPHLKSKEEDPGVLVVDDAAQYVIPVLSGHVGGANEFAEQLAACLHAKTILTTASDARNTIAVDIFGRERGWKVEAPKWNIIRVSAFVVNEEPVALVQEAGEKISNWLKIALPANIHLFDRLKDVDLETYKGVLWVTHKDIPEQTWSDLHERLVVYRPLQKESA